MALSTKPPKPPNSPSVITTLSSLTPSTNGPVIAILLGIDGPRQVTLRATSRHTLVANLLLCDDTHEGRKLSLWGHAALRATHLRILDILQLTRITLHHASDELRLAPGGTLTTVVPSHSTPTPPTPRVAELLRFRGARFRELCALAARGRLLAREWGAPRARQQSGRAAIREFASARIACARIRVERRGDGGKLAAVRAVCRRVCRRCERRLPREWNGGERADKEVRCACGGATEWRFGWLLLGVRGIDVRACGGAGGPGEKEDMVFVVVEGEALGRLLFGVDVRRIVAESGVAMACYDMLETLVKDGGVFHVVLRVGAGRPRLLDLHV